MVKALQQLGVEITVDWEEKEMVITGCGGRFSSKGAELYLGNAGTAMRSGSLPFPPPPPAQFSSMSLCLWHRLL